MATVLVLALCGWQSVAPEPHRSVAELAARLGAPSENNLELIRELSQEPLDAAHALVKQLEVVGDTLITGDRPPRDSDTLRVVWTLRALQYITGGKYFTAPTDHLFQSSPVEQRRLELLSLRSGRPYQVAFFATWMSRDSIYLAPADAQRRIIDAWTQWLDQEAASFTFAAAAELNDWYF